MSTLVQEKINSDYPALLERSAFLLDPVRKAHVPADLKRELLRVLFREAGAEALLSVGQAINTIEYDPVWYYALRSRSPKILFDKWCRFERYAHSTNRVRIEAKSDCSAIFTRYGINGDEPIPPENLLICGLVIALLEAIGCQNLECYMQGKEGNWFKIRESLQFVLPESTNSSVFDIVDTGCWRISWQAFIPCQSNGENLQGEFNFELPPIHPLKNRDRVQKIVQHISNDISRVWKVEDVALEMGYSIRSLQRLLTTSNLNFSKLIRLVRIQSACKMLSWEKNSLTAIAFCLGFSDSAHFSRDFKASMGLSPSAYRKSLCL